MKSLALKLHILFFLIISSTLQSNAQIDWLFLQGDDEIDEGSGIVVDSRGYVYVSGVFEGLVDFDPTTGQQNVESNKSFFLQKLDENNNLIWVQTFPGNGDIYDMHIDDNDDIYISGRFTNSAFGMVSSNSSDGFVVKFDNDGVILWSKSIQGVGRQQINGMAIDDHGDLYLTGEFAGNADLDPGSGQDLHVYSGNFQASNPFMAKWSADGQFIWGQSYQSADRGGLDIVVDSEFNIYNVGFKLQFNHYVHFIDKFDSSGNLIWNKAGTGNYSGPVSFGTRVEAIALDQYDNLFIAGSYAGEVNLGYGDTLLELSSNGGYTHAFVQCLDTTGHLKWTKTMGNIGLVNVADIKVGPNDEMYLTGVFSDSLEFSNGEPSSLEVSQSRDLYMMSWNSSDGSFNWVETIGGTCDYSWARALAYSYQGDVYGAGTYYGTVQNESGVNVVGFGDYDCIVYKIGATADTKDIFNKDLSVFPNPIVSGSTLTIELDDSFGNLNQIELYNSSGMKVMDVEVTGVENNIEIPQLESGLYFMTIRNKHNISSGIKLTVLSE